MATVLMMGAMCVVSCGDDDPIVEEGGSGSGSTTGGGSSTGGGGSTGGSTTTVSVASFDGMWLEHLSGTSNTGGGVEPDYDSKHNMKSFHHMFYDKYEITSTSPLTFVSYDENNKLRSESKCEQNKAGNITKVTDVYFYKGKEESKSETTYTYNANEQLTKIVCKDEESTETIELAYDGTVLKSVDIYSGEELYQSYYYKYPNKIENKFAQYVPTIAFEISYGLSFNDALFYLGLFGKASSLLPEQILYSEDDEYPDTYEYELDEKGRILKVQETECDSPKSFEYTYE